MAQTDRLLRLREILNGDKENGTLPLLPISKTFFYKMVDENKLPAPQKIGKRVSVWPESAITNAIKKLKKKGGL